MIEIKQTDSEDPDFLMLVAKLDALLRQLDGDDHSFYAQFNKVDRIKHVLVAYENNTPVGCGAIKQYDAAAVEIKRMFVEEKKRGHGIASAIVGGLEKWAAELGYRKCVLETGKRQIAAVSLYHTLGYKDIPNYGQYAGVENSICMEKEIVVEK